MDYKEKPACQPLSPGAGDSGIPGQPEGKRFQIQYIGLNLLGGTRSYQASG